MPDLEFDDEPTDDGDPARWRDAALVIVLVCAALAVILGGFLA